MHTLKILHITLLNFVPEKPNAEPLKWVWSFSRNAPHRLRNYCRSSRVQSPGQRIKKISSPIFSFVFHTHLPTSAVLHMSPGIYAPVEYSLGTSDSVVDGPPASGQRTKVGSDIC